MTKNTSSNHLFGFGLATSLVAALLLVAVVLTRAIDEVHTYV